MTSRDRQILDLDRNYTFFLVGLPPYRVLSDEAYRDSVQPKSVSRSKGQIVSQKQASAAILEGSFGSCTLFEKGSPLSFGAVYTLGRARRKGKDVVLPCHILPRGNKDTTALGVKASLTVQQGVGRGVGWRGPPVRGCGPWGVGFRSGPRVNEPGDSSGAAERRDWLQPL